MKSITSVHQKNIMTDLSEELEMSLSRPRHLILIKRELWQNE